METQEKLVNLADQMIRERGYNAFSYKDLSFPLQIKNAAVHYHFPVKADLGVAVINQAIRRFAEYKREWSSLSASEQLKQFIQMYVRDYEAGRICLMGSLTPDYQTLPDSVQEKIQEMGHDILSWLTICLQTGREQGTFHFTGDPYDRALQVVSILLSALLLTRVLGKDTFQRMYNQLLSDTLKK